ncbi:MAG: hypothetical protein BAJATHORv1_40132 [Candidatus Thorarchaeota archaeon]|nr:MAG: hypothetical protein BAJATHORv1_40132 [Candidatus Thorarchaeota archaeon]
MDIQAVLFDLHHKITKNKMSPIQVFRDVCESVGLSLGEFSDEKVARAFSVSDKWLAQYCVKENVGPLWGQNPEDWIDADRMIFSSLGIDNIDTELILEIEKRFKYETRETDYETLTEDGRKTICALYNNGFKLGICTRRHDDPRPFLKRSKILHMLHSVTWSGVKGYAKPNPYTLLKAAGEIEINPKLCAFVGFKQMLKTWTYLDKKR